ncbi:MAG: hypothetical protein NC429_12590 [Lachnospiraceae bacterium]|nr:hypothetical protein [Lachnospiraceae bacterium]
MKNKKTKIIVPLIPAWLLLMGAGWILYQNIKEMPGRELPLTADGYYKIASADDYFLFWDELCVKNRHAKARLVADISLNEVHAQMMKHAKEGTLRQSSNIRSFSGVFDGDGHTIYGLYHDEGFGLVERNCGEIRNLSIRDSLVYADNVFAVKIGGICKENHGVIEECDFGGKLCSTDDSGSVTLAGICTRNLGTIVRCGFSGTVDVSGKEKDFDAQIFGICTRNEGEIVNCYNLADLSDITWDGYQLRSASAITDQGEKHCFTVSNLSWNFSDNGQTVAIDYRQAEHIPALIHEDFYDLFVKDKKPEEEEEIREALKEETVSDLIMDLIAAKGRKWDDLSLEAEISEESVLLIFSDGEEEITMKACSGQEEAEPVPGLFMGRSAAGEEDEEEDGNSSWQDDFEGLWKQCAENLGEKDADSFEHASWQIADGFDEEETVFGNLVLFETAGGREGFFLQKDRKLYQVESRKAKEEPEMYRGMLRQIWKCRRPSVGILWESEAVRDAALSAIEEGREKAEDLKQNINSTGEEQKPDVWETAPSREELYYLETLSVKGIDDTYDLSDLAKMPHLKSLFLSGKRQWVSDMNSYLEKAAVPELEELEVYGMRLTTLDFLEQFPQLKRLAVRNSGLKDISGLKHQKELTEISFYHNKIQNIWALRNCKKLERLSVERNQINDISVLASLTELREIDVSHNEIDSAEPLQWLGKLKSLSCCYNEIQNIDVLKNLTQLQDLDLSHNEIEDFEPITGLAGLRYLDISYNPGQNIGDLVFVPWLHLGNGVWDAQGEKWEEAQRILDLFYPDDELIAQDMVKGDLNHDGILDTVITGLNEENPESFLDDTRKIYIFLGKSDNTLQKIAPIDEFGPGYDGGDFGGDYRGMLITDGRLVLQIGIGGTDGRQHTTWIYEYKQGSMQEKWKFKLTYYGDEEGAGYIVTDKENQREQYYVITDDGQLFMGEDNGEPSAVEKDFQEKYLQFQKDIGRKLPAIGGSVYPFLIGDYDSYSFPIYDTLYDTAHRPCELLSEAAGIFLSEYQEFPVPCYASEEILHNCETIAGVELPQTFFIGFRKKDGEIVSLSYDMCRKKADGSLEHTIAVWHVVDGKWAWKEDITYNEADMMFAAG